jgi:hypothetical protein
MNETGPNPNIDLVLFDPKVLSDQAIRERFEHLMLHPPALRKHIQALRVLAGSPSPSLARLPTRYRQLLRQGPYQPELDGQTLRRLLCDETILLELQEAIWGTGDVAPYWLRKLEEFLDLEARVPLHPEVEAEIQATVAAAVEEFFSNRGISNSAQSIDQVSDPTVCADAQAGQSVHSAPKEEFRTFVDQFVFPGKDEEGYRLGKKTRCRGEMGPKETDPDEELPPIDKIGPPEFGPFRLLFHEGAERHPLVTAIRRFLEQAAREAWEEAMQNLRHLVGVLTERFQAFSACLFVLERQDVLRAVVAYNYKLPPYELKVTGQQGEGIVSYVASQKRGYLACNLLHKKDPWFRRTVAETQSALAVPLLHADGRLLAVLYMESCQPWPFATPQIAQVQAEAGEIIPQILILNAVKRRDASWCPWNPEFHGMDLAGGRRGAYGGRHHGLLQRLCEVISASLNANSPNPDNTSCTFWYVDHPKNEVFVYATCYYDYEFVTTKTLELRDENGDPGSFTGYVATLKQCGYWKLGDAPYFVFFEKARARGMKAILSAPVRIPGRNFDRVANAVLSIYFFDDRPREAMPHVGLLDQVVEIVGLLIANYEQQRQELTVAYLRQQLFAKPQSAGAAFIIIRDILADVLEADGVSLFLQHPGKPELECVATTGLAPSTGPIIYDLDRDPGYTTYLAKKAICLRKNDIPDYTEKGVPPDLPRPLHKYMERPVRGRTDHRRFLGIGAVAGSEPDCRSAVVVRLIRPSGSKPFTLCDERLLQGLVKVCLPVFGVEISPPGVVRSGTLAAPLVEELLQDLVEPFPDSLVVVLGYHRQAAEEPLTLYAHHWKQKRNLSDNYLRQMLTKPRRVWEAVRHHRKPVTFRHEGISGIRFPLLIQEGTSGIRFPFLSWTGSHLFEGVVAVERRCGQLSEWPEDHIKRVFDVTRKIAAILANPNEVGAPTFSVDEGLVQPAAVLNRFLTVVHAEREKFCPRWVQLYLRSEDRHLAEARGDLPKEPRQWRRVNRDEDEDCALFGVREDRKLGALLIPLYIGCFKVGRLACGFGSDFPANRAEVVSTIFRLWSQLSFRLGAAWKIDFNPRAIRTRDKRRTGICLWKGKFMWSSADLDLKEHTAKSGS